MLKWGSKMRPPFLNDLNMKYHTTGHPTGESKASQILKILKIPMFRALLKTRPFLPCGRRRISVPCPDDPCPDLVDPCPEIWGPFLPKKKGACGNVPRSSGLVKIWGPFLPKKSACGNVPRSSGLVKIWGPFF